MANNFFLNNDPLLFQQTPNRQNDDIDARKLNEMITQYRQLQQNTQANQYRRDYINDLEVLSKNIDSAASEKLKSNSEYSKLNSELTEMIQSEIMSMVKWRINANPNATKNMERQIEIINEVNSQVENDRKESLNELNDYVKNYSSITFDEYKKIKNGDKTNMTNENR